MFQKVSQRDLHGPHHHDLLPCDYVRADGRARTFLNCCMESVFESADGSYKIILKM